MNMRPFLNLTRARADEARLRSALALDRGEAPDPKRRGLFRCAGNSGHGQMAAGRRVRDEIGDFVKTLPRRPAGPGGKEPGG
jgi:hypothetical protein